MRRPELLIPAGDLETLRIAVIYGADAVYVGGEVFSLRAKARNFSLEELKEGIAFAHARGVRVYVAANVYAHSEELEGVRAYLRKLKEVRPDALIVSDLGVIAIAKEELPETELHISTQWSNTNYETYRFWYELGARKVVAARELSLQEIREIRSHIPEDMQIECFIHGAMCVSYSGKCQLSNCFTGMDSNHGACTHPCRWKYRVYQQEEGQDLEPASEAYQYVLNSKDLCMIEHIPDLLAAGIDSLKVEGRMKTVLYVATIARAYRRAIDEYLDNPGYYEERLPWYTAEVRKCTYREYFTGFFYGKPDEDSQIYDCSSYQRGCTYLGFVEEISPMGRPVISQRNKFYSGDVIEVMKPDGRNLTVKVNGIYDEEGNYMESAPHPKQRLYLDVDTELECYDVLRMYPVQSAQAVR